jgi:hypothetical protein
LEKTSLAWLHHKIEEKNPAPIYPALIITASPKLPDNEGLQIFHKCCPGGKGFFIKSPTEYK